ncbi:hypothetical protein [Emticicia sp. 21SJ11W-3]|uniref:hypothetical protein n=1 Tax=Emticicia sp. 21SJ11W-3 TaxID=2916755 RepID=UPI0020A1172A|nr:hypothetical protein [Emticicia sp. 21SJ11W-3]UTA66586.1 hypothetical protein MB380_13345 [Emticicia sp. 21SJ11W-3]
MYYELEILLIVAMLIVGFFDGSDLAAIRKWLTGKEVSLKKNNLIEVKTEDNSDWKADRP